MAQGFLNFCSLGEKLYKFSLGFRPGLIITVQGILQNEWASNKFLPFWVSVMGFMVFVTLLGRNLLH